MSKSVRKQRPRDKEEEPKIEPIPSTHPEARDEGPRLLPLRSSKPETLAGQKYLDLADRALGNKAKK